MDYIFLCSKFYVQKIKVVDTVHGRLSQWKYIYWNFNSFNNRVIKVVCFEIIHEFKNENLDRNKIFTFVEQTLLNLWRNIDCEIGKFVLNIRAKRGCYWFVIVVSCFCLRVKWRGKHVRSRERARGTSPTQLAKMTEIEELIINEETT